MCVVPDRHPRLARWRPIMPRIRRTGTETGITRALRVAHTETDEEMIAAARQLVLARDAALWNHHCGVADYAAILAEALAWTPEAVTQVRTAGFLHDLGKLALPAALLDKRGPLTAAEFAQVREHPAAGSRLLAASGLPDMLIVMIRDHHERWDGTGYPSGLAGEAISAGGRVLAVADALDAMLRDRPYAAARPFAAAHAEIERCAGKQFDPTVVAAFAHVISLHGPTYFTREIQVLPLPQARGATRPVRRRLPPN